VDVSEENVASIFTERVGRGYHVITQVHIRGRGNINQSGPIGNGGKKGPFETRTFIEGGKWNYMKRRPFTGLL
jgi:hypothetical protein